MKTRCWIAFSRAIFSVDDLVEGHLGSVAKSAYHSRCSLEQPTSWWGGGGGWALACFLLVSLATVQAVQKRYRCGGGGGESCLWYQALDVARLSCDGCVLVLSLVVLDAGKSKRIANGK